MTEQTRESSVERTWAYVTPVSEEWRIWAAPPGCGAPGIAWSIYRVEGGAHREAHGVAKSPRAARREIRRRLRRARRGQ